MREIPTIMWRFYFVCALWLVFVGQGANSLGQATADSRLALSRIALGSCADQALPQPLWAVIAAWRPELFLFMGDNVYASGPQGYEIRQAYRQLGAIEAFRTFRDTVPMLAIWDDHDYGLNDGGAEHRFKAEATAAFHDFWKTPAQSSRRRTEGIYDAVLRGPAGRRVQVILLDTRSFRSPLLLGPPNNGGCGPYIPDGDDGKTMLGAAQWEWLDQQLRAPAEIRLLVSSIQVLADGHCYERWGNFPLEQKRLFDTIARTGASGIVLLSGDRHLGAIYREARAIHYPLVEVTSSSLNRPFRGASEPDSNRLGDVYGDENFGTIEIDWEVGCLKLGLRDLHGELVRQHAVTFAEIGVSR